MFVTFSKLPGAIVLPVVKPWAKLVKELTKSKAPNKNDFILGELELEMLIVKYKL